MKVRFDDALPILAATVSKELNEEALKSGVILRDAMGRLSFFSSADLEEDKFLRLEKKLSAKLKSYAAPDRVLIQPSDFGAARILESKNKLAVKIGRFSVNILDRRIVGADWLRGPVPHSPPPPRFVFSSIKGGVGRSTALAVVAACLANDGLRVLAIDLDIEAPGLGAILLNDKTIPEYGLIDALVENGISGLDSEFYADLIGPSDITEGRGTLHVIPVLGRRSLNNPAEVLAKISRSYMEDIGAKGEISTFSDQISNLVEEYSDPKRYDVILIDARAGLHETTASAILGLGAEVFLFGLDEPQTFQGFNILISHLARLSGEQCFPEWLTRLTMVQGKAPSQISERLLFSDRCQKILFDLGLLGIGTSAVDLTAFSGGGFDTFEWNDDVPDEAVLPVDNSQFFEPLAILDDPKFKGFNPQEHPDLLESGAYTAAYNQLLNKVRSAIPGLMESKI
ncbi:hypothetical protein J2T41_003146 [Pseudomonas citronellolis]|uniref:KGGVGR-motif variant AAA ATPase n=1 Tax=Pseudomonas citronellolis TaxID=53408 RepID=UPI0020A12BCA|nr:AAA family ATPase [Pseudomonas citronellolis]MCP1643522.1 hypothetical protein [Pseudomonas citronellolis]MCP1666448.1 hypothetical protein [Pseudomonas citronellolis]MCP1699326.1 hypothetical protein [Pseudomonas citronellolis]MCP1705857.1 hypothetical protein [Pseudomonas citronellolis]MCP1798181.1 hypothetical protein [Pseudomonas citronellolis]